MCRLCCRRFQPTNAYEQFFGTLLSFVSAISFTPLAVSRLVLDVLTYRS
jgi:hypothetical protein